jgi:hypothetical protein
MRLSKFQLEKLVVRNMLDYFMLKLSDLDMAYVKKGVEFRAQNVFF